MKVLVLGAGVVGTTTAYFLTRADETSRWLTPIPSAAMGTRYANAGQVSYGYASPWAGPGLPWKAVKWLLTQDAPLRLRPDGSLWQLGFIARMLRNCTAKRYYRNKGRLVELADFSREMLSQVRESLGVEYEGRQAGTLQLFRKQRQYDDSAKDIAVLEAYGFQYELVDSRKCTEVENALARVQREFVGGCGWLRMRPAIATSSRSGSRKGPLSWARDFCLILASQN